MLTQKLTGYFDVKEYNSKKPRENWALIAEEKKIDFRVSFAPDNLPQELSKYAKPYTDKNNNQRFSVAFKIGNSAKWFNAKAQLITKPNNSALDNVRYQAILEYRELNGDPKLKEACGYWVNSIMIQEVIENPFSAMAFDNTPNAEQPEQTPPTTQEATQYADKLPF